MGDNETPVPTIPEQTALVAELEKRLAYLKEEKVRLDAERKEKQSRLNEIDTRIGELLGSYSRQGVIVGTESKLALAKITLADLSAPKVVFSKTGYWTSEKNWVVSRVTPKRIYIRAVGESYEQQFCHDGKSPRSWKSEEIDVDATLQGYPELLKKLKRPTTA